jgi:hypothetical protein
MKHTFPRLLYNRIWAVMQHTTRYSFEGQARLAADAGVSKSAVSRLLSGESVTSYPVILAVVSSLERHLGRKLDLREVISTDDTYPTFSVCRLVGCKGCLPEEAYDDEGNRTAAFAGVNPGDWRTTKPLNGEEQ